MFVVESYGLAVALCFVTMLCWGSWANTQKLASEEWRFQLFYFDYSIGVLVLALIFAFTLGSIGTDGRGFLADLGQAGGAAIGWALLGGVIFNIGNIFLVAAIDIAGMAVAFPVGVGLALVIGTTWNFYQDYLQDKHGDPTLIFLGMGLVVVAIVLDAIAYSKLPAAGKKATGKGLVLSVLSGIALGVFYPFVAKSLAPDMITPAAGFMTSYSAVVVFSVGILASSIVLVPIIMYKPFSGEPVRPGDYFTKGSVKLHMVGLAGGIIWNVGASLNFIASGKAGTAISYSLGQGATMIAALWGVFISREFKGASAGTKALLAAMFLCYIAGLGAISVAGVDWANVFAN